MTVYHVPSESSKDKRIAKIRTQLEETLRPHVKKNSLKVAVDSVMTLVKPLLGPSKPQLGATVLTEAAAMGKKGAQNL